MALLLRADGKRDLNVRAVLFHVFGDALGGAAVILGGVAIAVTRAAWIDPAALALRRRRSSSSASFECSAMRPTCCSKAYPATSTLEISRVISKRSPAFAGVHDLHVWSIGSGSRALSAHVLLDDRRLSEAADVLREITECAQEHFGIAHVTIQFECDRCPIPLRH